MKTLLDIQRPAREVTTDLDKIEAIICLEKDRMQQMPDDYKRVVQKAKTRRGVPQVEDRMIVSKRSQQL